jgi:hypothetical protein
METSKHRWGVKFSSDYAKDVAYLQSQTDNIEDYARPGELFLNEARRQIYYVDSVTSQARGIMATPMPPVSIDWALTIEPDASLGRIFVVIIEGDSTINPPINAEIGEIYYYVLIQDSIGGHAVLYDASLDFESSLGLDPNTRKTICFTKLAEGLYIEL